MTLTGGILTFGAVVLGIVNARYQKAKNIAAKERITSALFSLGQSGFAMIALVLLFVVNSYVPSVFCFALSTLIGTIDFVRRQNPATRWEIMLVVLAWCGTTALIGVAALLKTLGVMGQIITVLEKHVRH